MTQPKPITPQDTDFFTNAEAFFEKNKKVISYGASALLIIIIAVVYLYNFYLPEREKEAQAQIFKAQQYFETDSFRLALEGDGNYDGFLKIIDNYSWTKAANLSHYYAGLSYLRTGDFDNAISQLDKFSSSEPVISAMALGAMGDAYSEKNEMDDAISNYKKAASKAKNEMLSPYFLFKAGLALKVKGSKEDALELFNKIKSEYPNSNEGRDIEKYIAMVS